METMSANETLPPSPIPPQDTMASPDCYYYGNPTTSSALQYAMTPYNNQTPEQSSTSSADVYEVAPPSQFLSPCTPNRMIRRKSFMLVPNPFTITGHIGLTTDAIITTAVNSILDLRSFKKYKKESKITRVSAKIAHTKTQVRILFFYPNAGIFYKYCGRKSC